jgi:hypothetical protein
VADMPLFYIAHVKQYPQRTKFPAKFKAPQNTVTFPKKTLRMVPSLRKAFNETFTRQRYDDFLADLNSKHPGAIEFRIAETPVFVQNISCPNSPTPANTWSISSSNPASGMDRTLHPGRRSDA